MTISSSNYADITVTFPMTDAQRTQLTELKEQAGALLTDYNEDTASSALKLLKSHYDEAVALLENEAATSDHATELISELPGLIQAVQEEQAGNATTKTGSALVNNFNYTAQVIVTYDPSTGKITNVQDNSTDPGTNSSFWNSATAMFAKFLNKTKDEVSAMNTTDPKVETFDGVSGATYSSDAIRRAVVDALSNN